MKNSLLLQLLETLSRKQMRELGKFVRSPFFNQREDVRLLYEYFWECRWIYHMEPSKKKASEAMHKGHAYDDHKVRMAMSFLLKTTENFLIINDLMEDKTAVKTRLSRIYRAHNLPRHFDRSLKEAVQLQEKSPHRSASYYQNNHLIQLERYQYYATQKRTSALNLQEVNNTLDIAYIVQKLKQTCLSIAHQTVYKTEYQFGLLNDLLHYIEKQNLLNIPAIAIYYHCYFAHTLSESQQHFQHFKVLILKHADLFPMPEIRDLYLLAINYCVKRYNEGNPGFLKDQLELYQRGLEQKLLLKDGIISRFTYRNVVTLGLILKEYDWVASFIYTYKTTLDKNYRESMYSYCLAQLEYSRQCYDEALQLLQKSEYSDLLLNLSAKTLLLKIFYELNEIDLLEAHLEAMKTFLRRKKGLGYHKDNYVNMIRFTKKILELAPYDAKGKIQLRQEIENMGSVAEKVWLMAQLH